jgi:glutathione S-transferase
MLVDSAFLLGDAPSVADFAAYHPLWFTRTQVPCMADILQFTPGILSWMDRIATFGHGQMRKLTAAEAIAVCAGSTRATSQMDEYFQDDHGIALGSQVSLSAESFGSEHTTGELVAATRTRYTLCRTDPRAGRVQVHFPRVGYALKLESTS